MSTHAIDVDSSNFQDVVVEGSKKAPVVIDFWAPWCGPCRALKPVLEKLAHEYQGRFTLAKINSDENQDLAREFGVRGIPAVKAVVDGRLVDEFTGALPESQVRQFIDGLFPSPADQARREAAELATQGDTAGALAALDRALALEPRNDAARVDKLALLAGAGRMTEARALLAALDEARVDEPRIATIRAQLQFAAGDDGAVADLAALQARIAADPADLGARLDLANQLARDSRFDEALEQLLEIVRRDRKFQDDIGRKTIVQIFNLPGIPAETVSTYRRKLSAALF